MTDDEFDLLCDLLTAMPPLRKRIDVLYRIVGAAYSSVNAPEYMNDPRLICDYPPSFLKMCAKRADGGPALREQHRRLEVDAARQRLGAPGASAALQRLLSCLTGPSQALESTKMAAPEEKPAEPGTSSDAERQ